MKYIIYIIFGLCPAFLWTQNSLQITLTCQDDGHPLVGANALVKGTSIGASSNENGVATLRNIPSGRQIVVFSYIGYEAKEIVYIFPLAQNKIEVSLAHEHEEMEEIIATSTRLSRDIAEIPTRIEAIAGEEVGEKINMRPNNVSMLLHESTGVQVQQNNYTSGVMSVRIQGLDGKYAQILKDGFATFGGFSGSMSLLDIPPLDLQQVEIIKGSASTLYGGGAISGMINFITKTPKSERELSAITNFTSIGGQNLGAFVSHQKGKVGYSLMASLNRQKIYDVDEDGFSELPKGLEYAITPNLFFNINEDLKIRLGTSFSLNDRTGGSTNSTISTYEERNLSDRGTAQLDVRYKNMRFKYGANIFERSGEIRGSEIFNFYQTNHLAELDYRGKKEKHEYVAGINLNLDNLEGRNGRILTQKQQVLGAFAQDYLEMNEKTALEMGLRGDYAFENGFFALPRLALLHRISPQTSLRLGGGMGYKLPNIYSEESESLNFQDIAPLRDDLKAEKSVGGTFDINYRGILGEETTVMFNQLFYYTQIQQPLVLQQRNFGYSLENQAKAIQSAGFESNLRITYADLIKLFAGYTFLNAQNLETGYALFLNPKHKLNFALIAEKHGNFKLGLEGYYTGKQSLDALIEAPSNAVFGLFAEKVFGKISVYINAENFTDSRQNKNGATVLPPYNNPNFAPIYMHTEGRYINGGLKLRL